VRGFFAYTVIRRSEPENLTEGISRSTAMWMCPGEVRGSSPRAPDVFPCKKTYIDLERPFTANLALAE
jgi:hypothetical protein